MTQSDQKTNFDYKAFLEKAPAKPGVYDMRNQDGKTLYIGKAKHLKNRLSSYFRASGLTSKTIALINKVAHIEIIITNSETEALILEQNLIKKHKPQYNILLKDDKSYPYIYISSDSQWPMLSFHRGKKHSPGDYFGPYPNSSAVRESLNLLQKVFKVRQCEDSYFRNRSRPCLQYQIKRCKAPCVGLVTQEEYSRDVVDTTQFLSGKNQDLLNTLTERMEQASSSLDFEQAAEIRDQIIHLRKVQEKQVASKSGDNNADIIGYAEQAGCICFNVLLIRNGQIIGSKNYFPNYKLENSKADYIDQFLAQFYIHLAVSRDFPTEVVVPAEYTESTALQQAISQLAGRKVTIKPSVRGSRLDWLNLANKNALQNLNNRLTDKTKMKDRVGQLQQLLSLPSSLEMLECFDISHTMGEATVASCVVFDKDGPLKSEYRQFNIKNITAGDDYAAMRQALERRYRKVTESTQPKPSLIIVDGGKGQLSMAEDIMAELNLSDIPLLGVAKGVTRKPGLETLLYQGQELLTDGCEAALLLIQQIRDEAHRFAIAGHRLKRQKARNRSVLEDIPGVGSKRRTALLKHFGGRQGVMTATIDSLVNVPGISRQLAQQIYDYLHHD